MYAGAFLRQGHLKEVVGMFIAWQEWAALVSDKNMSSSNLLVSNSIVIFITMIYSIQQLEYPIPLSVLLLVCHKKPGPQVEPDRAAKF